MADDAAGFFLSAAGRVPLLTPAEELHLGGLVRRWQDHDGGPDQAPAAVIRRGRRARDRIVAANLRLVAHVARAMRPGLGRQVGDADLPDVFQAGALGLVRGAERFDPARGYKFSTFGYWWIRQGISRWADSSSRLIRPPSTHAPKLARLGRVGTQLTAQLGRQPTRAELAEALGMSVADLDLVLAVGLPCRSLDAEVINAEDTTLGDALASPAPLEPDPLTLELRARLAALPPLQARLIRGRWGIGCAAQLITVLAAAEGISVHTARLQLREGEAALRGPMEAMGEVLAEPVQLSLLSLNTTSKEP